MRKISLVSVFVALSALPALAHTGHLADNGSGHEHFTALLALGGALGIAAAVAALALFRRARARRRA
jgi:hypothetical protein